MPESESVVVSVSGIVIGTASAPGLVPALVPTHLEIVTASLLLRLPLMLLEGQEEHIHIPDHRHLHTQMLSLLPLRPLATSDWPWSPPPIQSFPAPR